jgi:hypothetical protein
VAAHAGGVVGLPGHADVRARDADPRCERG